MGKTILVIIMILIVLVVAHYLFVGTGSSPQYSSEPTPFSTLTPTPEVSPATSPQASISARDINVSATEYQFAPSQITVASGSRVRIIFRNQGTRPHNFTIGQLNIATSTIDPGQQDILEFTAPNAGTYAFYCSVDSHRSFGMQGQIIVQ